MEKWTALLQAIGGVMWPVVVIIAVFVFRNSVREVLNRDELSISAPGGFALTAKRREAAAQELIKAAGSKDGERISQAEAIERVGEVEGVLRDLGRRPRVLWVDDRPSNNRWERSALENMGMVVELSTSTDDALAAVARRGPFDVIISDMGRPADPGGDRAGYELLARLRGKSDETPFVIYSSSRAPEDFDEAVRRGAVGCTNRSSELIDMVTKALRLPTRESSLPVQRRGRHLFRSG